MEVNNKIKDRLFRLLFGDERYKANALELYNAVNGTSYDDPNELEFDTIDDFIYMGMKNDVSFLIRDDLSIFEQQSTYNPNMPVRGFMYLGRLYDKYIKSRGLNVYGKRLLKLPVPRYIVFYNGTEEEYQSKDVFELRLSDAFEGKSSCVEMVATVYNINYGHNATLMQSCKTLAGYAQFVAKVRENRKNGMPLKEAIDTAVNSCISEGILKDILTEHRAEVVGMVYTEYNEVEVMNQLQTEARQEGLQEGLQEGRSEGEERILKLIRHLQNIGHTEDISRVVSDAQFREELLKSLGL